MVMGVALGVRRPDQRHRRPDSSALQQVSRRLGHRRSAASSCWRSAWSTSPRWSGILRVFRGDAARATSTRPSSSASSTTGASSTGSSAGSRGRSPSRGTCTRPGFLFGLGFDTVTEIGLLVIAGGAVAASLPWWAVHHAAGALRGRDVAARHPRRRVHERRLRLGVLPAGAQDLLQHHRHGALGRRRADHRRHRDRRAARRAGGHHARSRSPRSRTSTSTTSATASSRSSWSPGRPRSRSGSSAGSTSAGARTSATAEPCGGAPPSRWAIATTTSRENTRPHRGREDSPCGRS